MKKAGASVYADAPVVDQFVDELTINPASWVIYHLFNLKLVFWHDSLLFIMYYVLCIKGGAIKVIKCFDKIVDLDGIEGYYIIMYASVVKRSSRSLCRDHVRYSILSNAANFCHFYASDMP